MRCYSWRTDYLAFSVLLSLNRLQTLRDEWQVGPAMFLDDWRGSDPVAHSLLLFSEIRRQEGVLEERLLTNLSKQVGLLGLCEQTATIATLDLTVTGRKCFRGN